VYCRRDIKNASPTLVFAACIGLLAAVASACASGGRLDSTSPPLSRSSHDAASEAVIDLGLLFALAPGPEEEADPAAAARLGARRICIDPGHDAYWVVGASGRTASGVVPLHPTERVPLTEHELTLGVAYRLKALLEAEGAEVCVTRKPREEGGGLQIEPYDFNGDGRVRTAGVTAADGPERIQPRIDWANQFGAEVLVSIHFNGIEDAGVRGTEVYYSDVARTAAEGRQLASLVLESLLHELRSAGYAAVSRGVLSDRYQRYTAAETAALIATNAAAIRANGHDPARCPDCLRLLTLGNNPMSREMGSYLAILVEVEFLSNPWVVETLIMRPDLFDLAAAGIANGILRFFEHE
jgi:N-acetylmuramoyl-L-alanine amidase